jgi:hypothetical protein
MSRNTGFPFNDPNDTKERADDRRERTPPEREWPAPERMPPDRFDPDRKPSVLDRV